MFTGLHDVAHGVVDNGLRLSPSARTLPLVLRDAGWRTGGFFGGPYLDSSFGFGAGFEVYRSCMSVDAEDSHRDVTGPRTVEAVKEWLATAARGSAEVPLFLFIHLWDVHSDYMPPEGYADRFDPGYAGRLDARDLARNPSIEPGMSPQDLQHLIALYDGEILFTDENLVRILDEIDAHGRLREALVIVTADHGEEFFEHGGKGHQRTLFDEVVRVPLIFRWPGHLPAGRVVADPVRLVDLMPTILALAGVPERPPMQGRDVGPLLRGEALEPAPALMDLQVDGNEVRGLRTADSKTIAWRHAGTSLFYDLLRDPREQRPLAEGPGLAQGLLDLDRLHAGAAALAGARPAEPIEISPELARRLGGLGYAAGEAGAAVPRSK